MHNSSEFDLFHMQTRYTTDTNEDDREAWKALKRHFCKAAEKVVHDSLYNARITAVCHYYKSVKGETMNKKKGANTIYLTEEEYLQTEVDWLVKDIEAWRWLAKLWSSPEWIEKSESKRMNRGQDPGHKYGADGHFGLERRMVSTWLNEHTNHILFEVVYVKCLESVFAGG